MDGKKIYYKKKIFKYKFNVWFKVYFKIHEIYILFLWVLALCEKVVGVYGQNKVGSSGSQPYFDHAFIAVAINHKYTVISRATGNTPSEWACIYSYSWWHTPNRVAYSRWCGRGELLILTFTNSCWKPIEVSADICD